MRIDNHVPDHKPVLRDSQCRTTLSVEEKVKIKEHISDYSDVFAANPTKSCQNTILKHTINTQNALPQFRKPYQVLHAYQGEVNRQVEKMLKNEINRPSASP